MADRPIRVLPDGTLVVPWACQGAPTSSDMEEVAKALRAIHVKDEKGQLSGARIMFQEHPGEDELLGLGCHLQEQLGEMREGYRVLLEFYKPPDDVNQMISTPLNEMPCSRVLIKKGGVELLEG